MHAFESVPIVCLNSFSRLVHLEWLSLRRTCACAFMSTCGVSDFHEGSWIAPSRGSPHWIDHDSLSLLVLVDISIVRTCVRVAKSIFANML